MLRVSAVLLCSAEQCHFEGRAWKQEHAMCDLAGSFCPSEHLSARVPQLRPTREAEPCPFPLFSAFQQIVLHCHSQLCKCAGSLEPVVHAAVAQPFGMTVPHHQCSHTFFHLCVLHVCLGACSAHICYTAYLDSWISTSFYVFSNR